MNDKWFPEFNEYRAAAKRVAQAFGTKFVPFQTTESSLGITL